MPVIRNYLSSLFFIGSANYDNDSMMVLKVGSLILLMALAIVSVVLMYFVKKKVCITHWQTYTHNTHEDMMPSPLLPIETQVSAPASDHPDGWTQWQWLHLHKLQGVWVRPEMGVSQREPGTGYKLHRASDMIPDGSDGRRTPILYFSKRGNNTVWKFLQHKYNSCISGSYLVYKYYQLHLVKGTTHKKEEKCT